VFAKIWRRVEGHDNDRIGSMGRYRISTHKEVGSPSTGIMAPIG
jgi:hypothetical protein